MNRTFGTFSENECRQPGFHHYSILDNLKIGAFEPESNGLSSPISESNLPLIDKRRTIIHEGIEPSTSAGVQESAC